MRLASSQSRGYTFRSSWVVIDDPSFGGLKLRPTGFAVQLMCCMARISSVEMPMDAVIEFNKSRYICLVTYGNTGVQAW